MYDGGARIFWKSVQNVSPDSHHKFWSGKQAPCNDKSPKEGGIATFLAALGTLALAGLTNWLGRDSPQLTEAFRAGPIETQGGTSEPATPLREEQAIAIKGGEVVAKAVVKSAMLTLTPMRKESPSGRTDCCSYRLPAKFCQGNVDMRAVLGTAMTKFKM